jgi:hypothetical protein
LSPFYGLNLRNRRAKAGYGSGEGCAGQFNADVEAEHIFVPSARRAGPLYSSLPDVERRPVVEDKMSTITPDHNQIRCEVVTTYEQMLHAYAIRSIGYMEEHGVKARQCFDGNDYQATHMIVYAGDEPIGALRIRWFKDFAKLERTAFRKEYRNSHVLKTFAHFVFDHVARKGYEKVITHAQPKYARLWRIILGFKNAEGKQPLYFDGHEEPYTELVKDLVPPPNAISVSSDPAILFRVEGSWDAPSVYETAAA